MEHVVFFPAPDGSPAFRRCASLEEAVRYVEHLRNVEGITDVAVHTLSPVPLAFRAYYRVEVPAEQPAAEAPADVAPVALEPVAEVTPDIDAVPLQPQAADVQFAEVAPPAPEGGSNGKRSLGFFAH